MFDNDIEIAYKAYAISTLTLYCLASVYMLYMADPNSAIAKPRTSSGVRE